MITSKLKAFVAMVAVVGFTAAAEAGVVTYDLNNSPHDRLDDGGFHLRGANGWQALNFDADGADATLTYDSNAGTVSITGSALDTTTNEFLDFNVQYNDVTQNGESLTLNDMGTVGTFGGANVGGKGFNLTLGDTVRGDGWLTDAATGQHFGDFHFNGSEVATNTPTGQVPVPSPLMLIAAMALYFGVRRRRQSAAA